MQTKIRPSKAWYGASIGIFILGLALFLVILLNGIFSLAKNFDQKMIAPGTYDLVIEKPGKYTIYHEYQSVFRNKVYNSGDINNLIISIKDAQTQEEINLMSPLGNSNYSFNRRQGYNLFDFNISIPGTYEISAWYDGVEGEEVILVIGNGLGFGLLFTILLSILSLLIGFGLAIGLFLSIYNRRRKVLNTFS